MSGVNETKFLVHHESCDCKCGSNKSVWNSKQKWNHNECWCEFKKVDDWSSCKYDFMWNPSVFNCECNKACKIDDYLDIKNCSYEKCLFGKLVLGCEDEINTTEIQSKDHLMIKKNNYLIQTVSLVIICLLLLVAISMVAITIIQKMG